MPNFRTAEDIYRSRVEQTPAIRRRRDPVVYGAAGERGKVALDEGQVRHYEERGYLHLEGLFAPEEVEVLAKALNSLCASGIVRDSPAAITEPASGEVRSLFNVHRASPLFSDLARDRRLVEIARYLLGGDVYIHQSRINLKPGFEGKEFYWHSDFETWHVEDGMPGMRAVSCSIALTDNWVFNGPLMVIPGSHKYFISCVGETPEDNYKTSLKRQELGVPDHESLRKLADEGGIEVPTGRAGSALFFECNILHGSNGNITPYPRSNVFLVYNSTGNALVEPFGNLPPRPPFLASRDFSPLESKEPEYSQARTGPAANGCEKGGS